MLAIKEIRPDDQLLYTVEQAGAILACSRTSIYREMAKGRLRSLAIGGKRRISRQALLDFVAERERGG